MKIIKGCRIKLDNLYSKERGRILISLLITLIFFSVLYFKSAIVFFINDDENILYTLAGYYTNGETQDHSFVNFLLGGVIRLFYKIMPGVPWYGVFHVVVLFSAIWIVGKCILTVGYNNDISVFYPISLFSTICVILFVGPVILMQFTTTSALAGTAAVLLFLCADSKDSGHYGDFVLSIVFLLLCYMHRKNTGYIVLCYYALVAVYKMISSIKREDKVVKTNRIIVGTLVLAVISISLVTIISQKIVRTSDEWDYFYEYDTARYKMTDYPHDTFSENPELYQNMRWSESLYRLGATSFWFFMDERINVESFNEISATGYNDNAELDLNLILSRAEGLFTNEYMALTGACLCALLFVFILIICLKNKKYLDCLMACCTVGGALCMSLYLCWKGRFILRAFQVIVFPAIIILAVILLKNLNGVIKFIRRFSMLQYTVILSLGILVLVTGLFGYWKTSYEAQQRVEKSNRTISVEKYAMENPDKMYIYDTSLTFRYLPFVTYNEAYPSNVMFWGGMGWNSPAFNRQLEINNLDNLYSDVFFEENVYYVSYSDYVLGDGTNMMDMFSAYMNDTYGNVKFTLVEEIDEGVCVYKISKANPT